MAYFPIAKISPQYDSEEYANWWLKAYTQGTTTPILMALDAGGVTTVAKLELNENGFINTAGDAIVIPYINEAYDLWLFPTEAEADANDTSNAIQLADNIDPSNTDSGNIDKDNISTYTNYEFLTTADMASGALPDGTVVVIGVDDICKTKEFSTGNGGGGTYDCVTVGTTPNVDLPNGFNIIVSTVDATKCFVLRVGKVNITQFGAIKGSGDSTAAIQAALDYANAFNKGVVTGEDGVYYVTSITIPSFVTLKGSSSKEGWARLASTGYDFGFVIFCISGSNTNPVVVEAGTQNWGIEDLTIDGNKAGQTVYGQYCIETKNESSRNFGGLVKGVKCVNPNGFGAFFTGGPISVIDSFFMSGAVFSACSDLKLDRVDLDGTDGEHSSAIFQECNEVNMYNTFAYGWGEVDATEQIKKTNITINITSDDFTLSDSTWAYENAPVLINATTTLPTLDNASAQAGISRYVIRFMHDAGSGNWELYDRPFLRANSEKITFSNAGSGVFLTLGSEATGIISDSNRFDISGVRFAGNKTEGLRLVEVVDSDFSQLKLWGGNYRALSNIPQLMIIDSRANSFDNSQIGATVADVKRADYSVQLQDLDNDCHTNRFDSSCRFLESATGTLVQDDTTPNYHQRNLFDGRSLRQQSATTTAISSTNYYLEPGNQWGIFTSSSAQAITAATPLLIDWVLTNGKMQGMTRPAQNQVDFSFTKFSTYEISGQVSIAGYDATLQEVFLEVIGLTTSLTSAGTVFTVVNKEANAGTYNMSVPFSFKVVASADGTANCQVRITTDAGGAGMTVDTSDNYTRLSIRKISDGQF